MPLQTSPRIEEFFNSHHSKSDGKFTSGGSGKHYGSGLTGITTPRNARILGKTNKQLEASLGNKTRSADRNDTVKELAQRKALGINVTDPRVDRKIGKAGPESLQGKAISDAASRMGKPAYTPKNARVLGMSDKTLAREIATRERNGQTKTSDYKDMVQHQADRQARDIKVPYRSNLKVKEFIKDHAPGAKEGYRNSLKVKVRPDQAAKLHDGVYRGEKRNAR